MSKKLLVIVAVALNTLCFSPAAYAHVLVKDQVQGTGAILHVNPDDDPVAGESASLFFDIQDAGIAQELSQAKLTIIDESNNTVTVESKLTDSVVSANYTFPHQGLYGVKLIISQNSKVTHSFSHSQRVSRGIIGDVSTTSNPAWAEMGVIGTGLMAVMVLIIAFNRRKEISNYSKF